MARHVINSPTSAVYMYAVYLQLRRPQLDRVGNGGRWTCIVLCLFHAADTDKTRLFCLVRVDGVNWIGDKSRQFSVVLNIFETEHWKLGRDKTKLKLETWPRQDKTVLSCRQFSSHRHRRHGQDSFVLFASAVWNRHYVTCLKRVNSAQWRIHGFGKGANG